MSVSAATVAYGFVEPSHELESVEDLAGHLKIPIYSGHRARYKPFLGRNRVFDAIARRIQDTRIACEDQCSPKHYADLFEILRAHFGRVDRVVEVGVFQGGASVLLAGAAQAMDFRLDLVDLNLRFLQFAHERVRRTFPEAVGRVRLFHGDLPTYVHRVLREEAAQAIVHHDGAHHFTQVVKDLASLSYVQDKVIGVALQDTHLRGHIRECNFVDAAMYAVFGFDVALQPLGTSHVEGSEQCAPNRWQGNYFLPGAAEGAWVPFEGNRFRYPHPSMPIEDFLPNVA